MPAVIPIVTAVAGSAISSAMASGNASAAQGISSQMMGETAPYGMNTGLGSTSFSSTGSGNQVYSQLSPQYNGMEQGLLGSSAGFLGGLDSMGMSGGLSPLLTNAYQQYQNSLPNPQGIGFNQLYGQAFGNNLGTASNFQNAANGLLGNLSSFNPAASGQNYTNLLAQQSAPANALAAQNLTQQLFNSGALGSTGGANALGALNQGQAQQYVAQQLAGQQLGLQQSSLLGGLANQFGSNANAMNSTNFGLGQNLDQTLFGNQFQLGQMGLQNAIGLNQAGNQNLGTYGSLAQGLLGSGLGINNALLNQIQVGSQMGAARTGAAVNAGNINLQGQLAANNTIGTNINGLLQGLGNTNWQGIFGSPNYAPYAGGYAANGALADAGFGSGNFNLAPVG